MDEFENAVTKFKSATQQGGKVSLKVISGLLRKYEYRCNKSHSNEASTEEGSIETIEKVYE